MDKMFKKDIDKKKLLLKAYDLNSDSLTRLKHFKTIINHTPDPNDLKMLLKSHFSFIYKTFVDAFSTFDCDKQSREDLDCILLMFEKLLNYYSELNETETQQTKMGDISLSDLLQVFVLNSSTAFLTRVHDPSKLDDQVAICNGIMNIYRIMVMKICMDAVTWKQLLTVMLSITEDLFPLIPPENRESTIGGRIASSYFQTIIVSWIRANLHVHMSSQMWNEFHRVIKNLIRWKELIEEWSATMISLTKVLVKYVYGLSLTDLPLDKLLDRRRMSRPVKDLSIIDNIPFAQNVNSSGAAPQDLEAINHQIPARSMQSIGTCVLLGGDVRGWTPENAVVLWRRMLGLLGNINCINDPENHLTVIKCLAAILCDFIKTRENLGISLDNQVSPSHPKLIPPYTYLAGWLLEATHLPKQLLGSRLVAYKSLCIMSIRRHDIEPPQQYFTAFYEALHRGLTSPDQLIHATIIENSVQLLSLEMPGSTFLVQDLFERSKSILLNPPTEMPVSSSPRDQAIQILNTILALHRPIKKLMALKPGMNNHFELVTQYDLDTQIFDTLLHCNMRPIVLDNQTKSRSLCSMAIYVYQELCDKHDSMEVEKLFDTILTDLQDSNNSSLFRINCDLLRLFAEHAQSLSHRRPALVSTVIQIICQLIVRMSTNESNKEAIHCLLICLEDWCISTGKSFLLKPVEYLNTGGDNETPSTFLDESLMTIVLRALENVMHDEQYVDDSSNKGMKGSIHSSSHHSQGSSNSDYGFSGPRDRTITKISDSTRSQQEISNVARESKEVEIMKLACKVSHQRLLTYLGHFPLKQVGAASMSCSVHELDYLTISEKEFDTTPDVSLLVVDGTTIISFIGATRNMSGGQQPIHLIVRNLCGKYSWDATCIDLESTRPVSESEDDSITVDPDTFQQEDSRSSMKYDSDFNEDGNSSSSLSSRSSSNRDSIGDLLNQLSSLMNNGSLNLSSQNSYKKRNSAQSVSNPSYKVAQAEETMLALLTNQRFQELNYCERSNDLDRIILNIGGSTTPMIKQCNENYDKPQLSFEQCRQLIQQLGYLAWEKRCKVDSLAKSARLLRELKNLDAQPSRETHKIAVIYVANGQEDKNSILINSSGSRAFEDFVSGLGWEVNLASHLGFKGGLQSNKSTGETSPYYCNSTTEVMFHVSTRIPITGPADDESLNKKLRHLGNDEIHIIWSEHSRDYRRGIIPTEFGDVIIAIYPMLTFHGYYRIHISSKQEVPLFGPLFDNCIVYQANLASLVRATAINASRTKRFHLPYYQSHFEERNRLIETIVLNHREKLSFEDFAVQMYASS